jgi:leucyl aminopeptidase
VPTFESSSTSPATVAADLVVLPIYAGRKPGPGVAEVEAALGVDLAAALKAHGVEGKAGDTFTVPTFGRIPAASVVLVGMGDEASGGGEGDGSARIRRAAQRVGRTAIRFATVASTLPQVDGGGEEAAHAFAEGMVLGSYRFDRYKAKPIDQASLQKSKLKKVIALVPGSSSKRAPTDAGLRRGQIYADAANWARDLVNTPAIDATPAFLASEARKMAAAKGLRSRIWTKADLTKGGFGGILGVGSGSINEPRLIELEYRGGGAGAPIALTGKGVTFDSGGLSIKPAEGMEWMKADMGGAAATLAVMRAIAELKPKLNVVAAIPSSENMPDGSAIRPGDVLHHRGGKTSEVLNTDAEGRLILADALAYLVEKKPRAVIDSATLTGAAMIALGDDLYAVMGNDRDLIGDLLAAGREEGEPGWELPLWTDYRRHIESTVADVKNVGIRYGGAITAGLFLKEFVGDVPWAHMDVASTAFAERPSESWPRGATGSPARTIIRYLETVAARDGSGSRARRSGSRNRKAAGRGRGRS